MDCETTPNSLKLFWQVSRWLQQAALRGDSLEDLIEGCGEELREAGIPVSRAHFSFSMLHPLYSALNMTWYAGQPLDAMRMSPDAGQSERFVRSPYFHLLVHNLNHLRLRITDELEFDFPVLDDLKQQGFTDYLVFVQKLSDDGRGRAMLGSWATEAEGGFTDEMIAVLRQIQIDLAVAAKLAITAKLTENLLSTYIGGDAGQRVLSGQIRRGDAETVRSIIVMVDMRHSTELAEQQGRQTYFETLNLFFDAVAAPFNRNGGVILNFMGDGFLAIYPCERHSAPSRIAARAALEASRLALARMAMVNSARKASGKRAIGFGVGLHVGNVTYGNVGLRDRLTFSVFGAAVNEAARLQTLTKKYDSPILASPAFARYCGGKWKILGDEILRGASRHTRIHAPEKLTLTGHDHAHHLDLDLNSDVSEAELIIMLHEQMQTLS